MQKHCAVVILASLNSPLRRPSIKKSVSYLGSYVTMYVSEEHFKYLVKSEMPSKRPFMTIHLFHLGYFIVPLHKTQITMVFTSPRYRGLIHKDQFESVSFWRATYFICTDAERIITWSFLAFRDHPYITSAKRLSACGQKMAFFADVQ